MGHIVNSKGMRLGWVSSWCDHWFSELQFYPEYLHSIYRIRFFLVYFFNMHALEQRGFFFSHFDIIKIYKKLRISVFYYDGQGESLYADMLFDYRKIILCDISNTDPEKKVWDGFFEPLKILMIFNLLYNFNLLKWKAKKRELRDNVMKSFSVNNMKNIKYIFLNNLLPKKRNIDYLISKYLYFMLYFFNRTLFKKTNLYSCNYMESVLKRFFFSLLLMTGCLLFLYMLMKFWVLFFQY